MAAATYGIDISKNVFQIHGIDENGKAGVRKRLSRSQLKRYFSNHQPALVGMEACGGSHYWARVLSGYGHDVRLIAPQFVKPYVRGNKNDGNDAAGICEAVTRPDMRFVAVKTPQQTSILMLHRVRDRLMGERTALINQIRGYLIEFGLVIRKGASWVRRELPSILEDAENGIPWAAREVFAELYEELVSLDDRLKIQDRRLRTVFDADPQCKKLAAVEGVGVLTATAFVATIGDPTVYKNGRQVAAWLGLTPREHSSGGKQRQLGITKRGDCYLRKLLIHGARSALRITPRRQDRKSRWVEGLRSRAHDNVAAVALAAKNTRILWSLLAHDEEYKLSLPA
jgi:transposase